ncbi:ammonia-dependent NAD(+) synthetase [Noviherbaspirillum massiliense]|uniref:ammonia-dependent NAD(+) synthetase n=1 Tax=Noviherbaspirillum massiliense TaxID=1465823 RepID=UPI0003193001|nr:ammonia-dependent NAD(+) synthetase [Noviherbaspirillum massiliense]
MNKSDYQKQQQQIISELQVASAFDAQQEIERRVSFLCEYLIANRMQSYVLGISGGVDSSVAGRLAQLAVERARSKGHQAKFIAMRLPYGVQRDEEDAQKALKFIRPDMTLTVDIKPAADGMLKALQQGQLQFRDEGQEDFILGNIKARQRMIAQYAVAGTHAGLVIGTDHAAEALMGFFTKFGDGACDLTPLTGLNKRRVRAVAEALGAEADVVHKIPTADLENLKPLRPDEDAYGVTYHEIDDFLEGKEVSEHAYETILRFYTNSHHKRALPVHPA